MRKISYNCSTTNFHILKRYYVSFRQLVLALVYWSSRKSYFSVVPQVKQHFHAVVLLSQELVWRSDLRAGNKTQEAKRGLFSKAVLSNRAKEESQGPPNPAKERSYPCSFFPPCPEQSRCCNGTWSCQLYFCTCRKCTSQEKLCIHWYLKAEQSRNGEPVDWKVWVLRWKLKSYHDGK